MQGARANDVAAPRSAWVASSGRPGADARSRLRAGELHVWQYDLDRGHPGPPGPPVLSEVERGRAARLVFEHDRRRFRAGRIALRRTLSRYVGDPPESLALHTGAGGKPYLADSEIEFNVSHSQNAWICVLAHRNPVGVDVELLRAVPDSLALARRFFSPFEAAALASVPPEDRDRAFLTCWTRKEAYLKVLGVGIAADLGAFVAGFGPGDVTLESTVPGIVGDVHLHTCAPGPGAIAALAFTAKPSRIEYFVVPDQ